MDISQGANYNLLFGLYENPFCILVLLGMVDHVDNRDIRRSGPIVERAVECSCFPAEVSPFEVIEAKLLAIF
jgi:hypothetical protein